MHRFFTDPSQIREKEILLTGPDVNHIRNVLRMRCGDEILISNGQGTDYHCRLEELGEVSVTASVMWELSGNAELPCPITLFQGLPKGDKMEFIIQKAVELGVYRIIPVATRRAVVKLDKKKEEAKVRRWNGIAESAAKQSGRSMIPEVTGVMSFKEALTFAGGLGVKVIPFEHARGMDGTRQEFERIGPGTDAGIFIGPEGGFEDEEIAQAASAGVKAVSLGRRILRTETAGLMALSVIGYLLEIGEAPE